MRAMILVGVEPGARPEGHVLADYTPGPGQERLSRETPGAPRVGACAGSAGAGERVVVGF